MLDAVARRGSRTAGWVLDLLAALLEQPAARGLGPRVSVSGPPRPCPNRQLEAGLSPCQLGGSTRG